MGDLGMREIDILKEKLGNRLPTVRSDVALLREDNPDTKRTAMAQPEAEAFSITEHPSDAEFRLDEDSGSEYGVVASSKRKRRTNNSFVADLDDGDDDGIAVPPPPKRLQFSLNGKENSVLIGVWKDSPPSDPAKKHAVYAFVDNANRIRQKVYPETRNGDMLEEGYPSGTGRSFVPPQYVTLEPHLSSLSRQELREYIRIRTSQPQNESLEERKKAEAIAVKEAREITSQNTPIPGPVPIPRSTPSTPSAPPTAVNLATSTTPKSGIPNGVLLGVWKDSDAVYAAGMHATFGVVDNNKFRIKIIKYTQDGRPYVGNFPVNPGSNWISFDDVVREPALEKLQRQEIIEYVKLQQNEKLQRPASFDPFSINADAIKEAIETCIRMAGRQGTNAALLDAPNEAGGKALNGSRAAMRADPLSTKSSKYESPYTNIMSDKSNAQEARDREEAQAVAKRAQAFSSGSYEKSATTPKGAEAAVIRSGFSAINSSKNEPCAFKTAASENITGASKVDTPDGRAKAVRSNKAESDARAEKLRRVREANAAAAKAKESVKGDENTKDGTADKSTRSALGGEDEGHGLVERTGRAVQEPARQVKETIHVTPKRNEPRTPTVDSIRRDGELVKQGRTAKETDSMTPRQRAKKEMEAKEKELRAKEAEEHEAAETRAKIEKVKAEMEKVKRDAIESVSNEFFNNVDSFDERSNANSERHRSVGVPPDPIHPVNRSQVSTDVKIYNDVKYVRHAKGTFAGRLVGEKKECLTIDGEDYVECRVLMKMEL